ncbi:ion channel [Alloacidobacterium dinghuense]|nr:ion channel [Alloacidobacterium dinghuense]
MMHYTKTRVAGRFPMIDIQIPVLVPLATGAFLVALTLAIHALAVLATVQLFRREKVSGRAGSSTLMDVSIVFRANGLAFIAHLVEICLWAKLYMICGEFRYFGTAIYHSAVNYSTLGYGDIVMSPSWRLLGPIEAANGALMFGVSTAMIFAVIQGLVQIRYRDL